MLLLKQVSDPWLEPVKLIAMYVSSKVLEFVYIQVLRISHPKREDVKHRDWGLGIQHPRKMPSKLAFTLCSINQSRRWSGIEYVLASTPVPQQQ